MRNKSQAIQVKAKISNFVVASNLATSPIRPKEPAVATKVKEHETTETTTKGKEHEVVPRDKERETTTTNQAHVAAFKATATNAEEHAEATSANGTADATNEDNKTLSATTTTMAVATNKRHLAMQIQSSKSHANSLIAVSFEQLAVATQRTPKKHTSSFMLMLWMTLRAHT